MFQQCSNTFRRKMERFAGAERGSLLGRDDITVISNCFTPFIKILLPLKD